MATYALWNNKGGVGKSYLTFQIASEYARQHQDRNVLVVDMCPQANSSSMLLGGMERGEEALEKISMSADRKTIAGYVRERLSSPYHNPKIGAKYLTNVNTVNEFVNKNLFLVTGDEELEILSSRVSNATQPGPDDAWRKVHLWINDLIQDVKDFWNVEDVDVFIDCNPSFGIYTELALASASRLIIPFSSDGSSKRAVRAVLSLLYGATRIQGAESSEFFRSTQRYNVRVPEIYCYVGNRLTQANNSSAKAFRTIVNEIGVEISEVWKTGPGVFCVHPKGSAAPTSAAAFKKMFQFEVPDANTASVVSSSLGIPIVSLTAGLYQVAGKSITVNQTQLDRQQPNIRELVQLIE